MKYRPFAIAASAALLFALAGCGDRVEDTAEAPPEELQASVEINRQGMEGAKDEETAQGVENDTATMGAGPAPAPAVAAVAEDPDVRIAAGVKAALAANPDFGALKVDVHSDDGAVTLIGRAPDPVAKERATEIARSVPAVKKVDNLLTLG